MSPSVLRCLPRVGRGNPLPVLVIYATRVSIRGTRFGWLRQAQDMATPPESYSVCRTSARSGFGFARRGRLHRGEQECNAEVGRYPPRKLRGNRGMVTLIQRAFVVNVSFLRAWEQLARVEQWPSWAAHIKRMDLQPPGPLGPQPTGVIHLTNGMKSAFRMTEFDPPR